MEEYKNFKELYQNIINRYELPKDVAEELLKKILAVLKGEKNQDKSP